MIFHVADVETGAKMIPELHLRRHARINPGRANIAITGRGVRRTIRQLRPRSTQRFLAGRMRPEEAAAAEQNQKETSVGWPLVEDC